METAGVWHTDTTCVMVLQDNKTVIYTRRVLYRTVIVRLLAVLTTLHTRSEQCLEDATLVSSR